jgi:hypothetical protein
MTANGTLNNKKKLRGNSIANPPLEKDTYVGSWLCERGTRSFLVNSELTHPS